MTIQNLPATMRCISVRVPWTWFLMYGGKDIENRGLRFPRSYRGRVLLHASRWWNEEEILWDIESANEMLAKRPYLAPNAPALTLDHLRATRGHVIGSIAIVDYLEESDSPWFVGDLGIRVQDPVSFARPIPLKGMLGLFGVDTSTPEFREQLQPLASLSF